MKSLFKAFIAIVLFFSITEASAQISAGGGIVYGTDINNIGFSLSGKYEFNEKWAAAPTFTYFLKKDYVTWSALDFNANYQITDIENIGALYGIGGLGLTFWGFDAGDLGLGEYSGMLDSSTTEFGVNIGAGLKITASEKMAIAPEIMYTLGGANYLRIGVKVMIGL